MNQIEVINSLMKYCEKKKYKGWDVIDGIDSVFIRKTFLKHSKFFRFFFLQLTGFRMAYINLRPILFVKQYYNAKGIALFINGYCNLYECMQHGVELSISKEYCLHQIHELCQLLISLKNTQFHGTGWGYPFIWQSLSFCFPANTPTAVATSFAVEALLHAYQITQKEQYKDVALSAEDFITQSLHRTPYNNGFLFSYSPYEGNNGVYNASLLAARVIIMCNKYSHKTENLALARRAIQTCVDSQNQDGSWYYGITKRQRWIDNFHTGYNLEALQFYQDETGDTSFDDAIKKGVGFMLQYHFDKNGVPNYYHNKRYPIDIHCCGEIYVVLYKLHIFEQHKELADKVWNWTYQNMFNKKEGYFYFQKRKYITNKCPLMRWSEAFMFNALSYYLKSSNSI